MSTVTTPRANHPVSQPPPMPRWRIRSCMATWTQSGSCERACWQGTLHGAYTLNSPAVRVGQSASDTTLGRGSIESTQNHCPPTWRIAAAWPNPPCLVSKCTSKYCVCPMACSTAALEIGPKRAVLVREGQPRGMVSWPHRSALIFSCAACSLLSSSALWSKYAFIIATE